MVVRLITYHAIV